MDKEQAYSAFWGGFGVLAFEENSVPDDRTIQALIDSGAAPSKYPYITYQVLLDDLGYPVFPTASIYDRSSSWEKADLLANTISSHIQEMYPIKLEHGRMFITKGTPFAQHYGEDGDTSIRRIVLNVGVEFLTEK